MEREESQISLTEGLKEGDWGTVPQSSQTEKYTFNLNMNFDDNNASFVLHWAALQTDFVQGVMEQAGLLNTKYRIQLEKL